METYITFSINLFIMYVMRCGEG